MKERPGTAKHFCSVWDKKHSFWGERDKEQKKDIPAFLLLFYYFLNFIFIFTTRFDTFVR